MGKSVRKVPTKAEMAEIYKKESTKLRKAVGMKLRDRFPGQDRLWGDQEVLDAWLALNERMQDFLILWLTNGYNATKAYQAVYGVKEVVARPCGSRLLTNVNIATIRHKLQAWRDINLERLAEIEYEMAEDVTQDPYVRLTASRQLKQSLKTLAETRALDSGTLGTGPGQAGDFNQQNNFFNFDMEQFGMLLNKGKVNGIQLSGESPGQPRLNTNIRETPGGSSD